MRSILLRWKQVLVRGIPLPLKYGNLFISNQRPLGHGLSVGGFNIDFHEPTGYTTHMAKYTYIVVTQLLNEWDGMSGSPSVFRLESETSLGQRDIAKVMKPHGYDPTKDSLDFFELSLIPNITPTETT